MRYILFLGYFCSIIVAEITKHPLLTYDELIQKMGIEALPDVEVNEHIISNDQLINGIVNQLYLKNIDRIGLYITRAPISLQQKIELLLKIMRKDAYGFTYDDKTQLILYVANDLRLNRKEQAQILNIFLSYPELLNKTNPFFIAAEYEYKHVLSFFEQWIKSVLAAKPEMMNLLKNIRQRSLLQAVEENKVKVIDTINSFTQKMTNEEATNLLWHVVREGKGALAIEKLKELGANIDALRDGKTPIVEAVKQRHADVVKSLIDAGANIHIIGDPEIGSTLQQAIEQHDVEVERLLRAAGAHE